MVHLTAQFNARVEKFLQRAGFKSTEFWRQAIDDPTLLVVDFCAGGVRRSWRRATGSSPSSRPMGGSSRRSNRNNGRSCFRCTLLGTIEPDPVVHNPKGIFTTYLKTDRILVTGER